MSIFNIKTVDKIIKKKNIYIHPFYFSRTKTNRVVGFEVFFSFEEQSAPKFRRSHPNTRVRGL